MEQIEFFEITNPCIGVCQSGPKGFCMGCFRSREERQYWNQLDDGVKRKIVTACAKRKKRALSRKKTDTSTPPPQQDSLF